VCGTQVKYDYICPQCKTERPVIPERAQPAPVQAEPAQEVGRLKVLTRYLFYSLLFGLSVGGILVALLLIGIFFDSGQKLHSTWSALNSDGQQTTATITAQYFMDSQLYLLEYAFKTSSGVALTGSQFIGQAHLGRFQVGDQVTIRYVPDSPYQTMLWGASADETYRDQIVSNAGICVAAIAACLLVARIAAVRHYRWLGPYMRYFRRRSSKIAYYM
jgi:hypothetical protein